MDLEKNILLKQKDEEPPMLLQVYLKNQMEYLVQAMKLLDNKARIIIRINSLLIAAMLFMQSVLGDIFFRFKPLLIIATITSAIALAFAILVIKPHIQFIKNFYKKYIAPYSDLSFNAVVAVARVDLDQKEITFDQLVKDGELTLKHMSRVNFIFQFYHGIKYSLLDWAFRVFLITIVLIAPIFLLSTYEVFTKKDRITSLIQKADVVPMYNLHQANQTWELPKSLKEISGLVYDNEDQTIYSVNDEEGSIFEISILDGSIVKEIKFEKKGDYEGIASNEKLIVVARHDGALFFHSKETNETKIVKTALSKRNDVEGLTFINGDSLLIACKGRALDKHVEKDIKTIYLYDLSTNQLQHEPFISISVSDILSQIKKPIGIRSIIAARFDEPRIKQFAPSGIAVHPTTGDFYILSARGSSLVVLDRHKNLSAVFYLDEEMLPQPEGICFDKKSNLYISTEGQKGKGRIMKFKMYGSLIHVKNR